jgi:hypothetical protein
MRVYKFTSNYKYSGGCLLIAAEHIKQARVIAEERYDMPSAELDEGRLVSQLESKYPMPGIIIDALYIE